jgi:hypothetical protein
LLIQGSGVGQISSEGLEVEDAMEDKPIANLK